MKITREDIVKVAALSKLQLSESEFEVVADKFVRVLDFVEQLNQVDTSGIEEMAHPVDVHTVTRQDSVEPSLPREVARSNAPKSDGEFSWFLRCLDDTAKCAYGTMDLLGRVWCSWIGG